ncbi:MAG: M50 family metallopeptidase [Chloroflexota bacterium]
MSDVLLFVLIAGGLILGHELGHLLMARWRGVAVTEFGIGFPPRLIRLGTIGGTAITLNAIPFGGFVRIAGEDDPKVLDGLAAASKTTRTLVLLGGIFANLLLGYLAFSAAYRFAAPDPERVLITAVQPDSPAAQAGIEPGDLVLEVDGVPIRGIEGMQQTIAARLGQDVNITLSRQDQAIEVQLVPRVTPPEGEGPIGVLLGNPTRRVGTIEALRLGAQSMAYQFTELLLLPGHLLRGEVTRDQIRLTGIKGMYDMVSWASDIDRSNQRPFLTLQLAGLISVGLAITNLLPVPALDGGRLVFVLLEAILRRRVAPRFEGLVHAIGFTFLIGLMVYITVQDVVNPIPLPR